MAKLDPEIADEVPWADEITSYDEDHFITYLRLLDAEAEGADWREVARIVLHRDSDAEPDVSNTLQIRGLPTILLINDMSVIMRVEGALEANELLQLVDHYLFGGPPPQLGENLESVGPTQ